MRRIGRACANHPLTVISVWVLAVVLAVGFSHKLGATYSDNINLSGTESATGFNLLSANDPSAGGHVGDVVVQSSAGDVASQSKAVGEAVSDLEKLPDVTSVANPLSSKTPLVSPDGKIAIISVHVAVVPSSLGKTWLAQLEGADGPLGKAGLTVAYGGQFDQLTNPKASDIKSELVGFVAALVVLLVAFGSLAAAVTPLVGAVLAVLVGLGLLGIAASSLAFGTVAPTLATMIGLGVGIDYSVFLITRHRQRVIDGAKPVDAAADAVVTSGKSVLVAATTVSIALVALFASGVTFLGMLGVAAVFGVLCAAAGAITLVPAFLGLLGSNVDKFKVRRRPVAEAGSESDCWHRYALGVRRRPGAHLVAGLVLLGVIAIPLASMRIGTIDDGANPLSYSSKQAYDLIAKGFGPGANGPFTVVVQLAHGTSSAAAQSLSAKVTKDLAGVRDVARMSPLTPTPNGALLVGQLIPSSSPQQGQTTTLFDQLVGNSMPQALAGSGATGYVTGNIPLNIQFASTLASKLPLLIAVVVACGFALITTAFRSLVLAVKAALLNLVSISAAYGVVVAVFQWGWGRSVLGVSENVPIESYVPVFMFAIVFGLSMDYEIFLVSRVKEHWDRTGDAKEAVEASLAAVGRVVASAALIMGSVFVAFVGSTSVEVKMIAVGLAAAVILDAFVVRMVLVPSIMNLLGPLAWWLPKWLDSKLPRIDVDPQIETKPAVTSSAAARP
jgi:RND superfamily putative drug exporter